MSRARGQPIVRVGSRQRSSALGLRDACAGRRQIDPPVPRRFACRGRQPCDRERQDRDQIIALPGRIRTQQKVSGQHGEQCQDRRRPAGRAHQHHDQGGHGGRSQQVERPPCRIAHAADRHDRRMNTVDQRHVDVGKVAIRNEAHQELIGHEMKDRGVARQRPGERAPQHPRGDGNNRHVDDRDQPGRGQSDTWRAVAEFGRGPQLGAVGRRAAPRVWRPQSSPALAQWEQLCSTGREIAFAHRRNLMGGKRNSFNGHPAFLPVVRVPPSMII